MTRGLEDPEKRRMQGYHDCRCACLCSSSAWLALAGFKLSCRSSTCSKEGTQGGSRAAADTAEQGALSKARMRPQVECCHIAVLATGIICCGVEVQAVCLRVAAIQMASTHTDVLVTLTRSVCRAHGRRAAAGLVGVVYCQCCAAVAVAAVAGRVCLLKQAHRESTPSCSGNSVRSVRHAP